MYGPKSMAIGILFALGTVASPFLLAQSSNQAQKNSSMHMSDMMQQCRTQCRQTEGSIDKTIKQMDDAKQSGDPAKMRTALTKRRRTSPG